MSVLWSQSGLGLSLPPGPSEIEGGSSSTDLATPSVWMKISPAWEVSMCDKIFDLENHKISSNLNVNNFCHWQRESVNSVHQTS